MSQLALVSLILATLASARPSQPGIPADNQDLPLNVNLSTYPPNSLFTRWRPSYHVLAPAGHMNDPCGPMYDPVADTYHIFYQAFPNHINFGNTTWEHAVSKDLITWTDVTGWKDRGAVAVEPLPYPGYDWLGVFSGGAYSTNLNGKQDGTLMMFYTGEQAAPDFWRAPYKPGLTEHQNIATSSDGGRTWTKYANNPVIPDTPGGWNATGVRDPLFGPNPDIDAIRGVPSGSEWYMTIGTGIRDVGPRIALFTAPANNLTDWNFSGPLYETPLNSSWGDVTRTGSFGGNFEMSTVYSLPETEAHGGDGTTKHWLVNMGAEGFESAGHPLTHWSLFALGALHRTPNGSVSFETKAAGPLDWGNSYALNSFHDAKHGRRVLWGWSDEDLAGYAVRQQGFQGSLGLPREVYITKTSNVRAPPAAGVVRSPEIWAPQPDGTYTVTTVAQRPLPDVLAALQGPEHQLGAYTLANTSAALPSVPSSTFHLRAVVSRPPTSGAFGVRFRAAPDAREATYLTYRAANASITLDRSASSLLPNVSRAAFAGHFEPWTVGGAPEPLVLDLFVDGSLVEVFANDRFALTSRVYPSKGDATGLALFAEGADVVVDSVSLWTRFADPWPQRPRNSSSALHVDPFYETHVLFDNPFVETGYQIYAGD